MSIRGNISIFLKASLPLSSGPFNSHCEMLENRVIKESEGENSKGWTNKETSNLYFLPYIIWVLRTIGM